MNLDNIRYLIGVFLWHNVFNPNRDILWDSVKNSIRYSVDDSVSDFDWIYDGKHTVEEQL